MIWVILGWAALAVLTIGGGYLAGLLYDRIRRYWV